ncbi:50S ribosomal protein L4 [Candidatus Legionella polyplacis]|uniref:Large ribosomal subunit protein uL4 n=1 Tax=Candidatus Legionella polyplacis TaxID=2005262 RepID=A0ABZ2GW53_9GAMM|nr:50S ribosomal protein L4 [Candidatus Legionella polyplacis]ATW01765.1 50S ribosomal protein L4 [Candidatus Legionella polyplacis]
MIELLIQDTNEFLKVDSSVFNCKYNPNLIHQVFVSFMQNRRSGNSSQKTRSEVSGSGIKPWRQKGTGRARAGTIRSPLWRGGGVVFASKKRNYIQKINKKMYRYAFRSVVSELYRLGNLIVVSCFFCDSYKTKYFINKMQNLNVLNGLILKCKINKNELLGSKNLYQYKICNINSVSFIDFFYFKKVLITKSAVKVLEKRISE